MANPQTENGFTKIANELLEGLIKYKCSGTQKDLILALIRATYGFHKKSREVGIAYFTKLTGRNRRKVASDVAGLIRANVFIEVERYTFGKCRTLKLNKDFEQWVCTKTLIPPLCTKTLTYL